MHVFENVKHALQEGKELISREGLLGHANVFTQIFATYVLRHQPLETSAFEWAAEEPALAMHAYRTSTQVLIRWVPGRS